MDRNQIKTEITALEAQLRTKISERDNLNVVALGIEEKIRMMYQMYFTEALAEKGRALTAVGLTEAIRIILRKQNSPVTAATIKAALEVLGFDLKRLENPSAAVHNTLIRMSKAGELRYDEDDKTYHLLPRWDLNDHENPLYVSGIRPFPGKKK